MLYRCYNQNCADNSPHGFDFETDALPAVCPKCSTSAADKRFGRLIVRLETIHYEAPSHVKGYGVGHAACVSPGQHAKGHRTADPNVANCRRCRESEACKAALAEAPGGGAPEEHDFRVGVDAAQQVIVKQG